MDLKNYECIDTKTQDLINGYIRIIQKSFPKDIIPIHINYICGCFYFHFSWNQNITKYRDVKFLDDEYNTVKTTNGNWRLLISKCKYSISSAVNKQYIFEVQIGSDEPELPYYGAAFGFVSSLEINLKYLFKKLGSQHGQFGITVHSYWNTYNINYNGKCVEQKIPENNDKCKKNDRFKLVLDCDTRNIRFFHNDKYIGIVQENWSFDNVVPAVSLTNQSFCVLTSHFVSKKQ